MKTKEYIFSLEYETQKGILVRIISTELTFWLPKNKIDLKRAGLYILVKLPFWLIEKNKEILKKYKKNKIKEEIAHREIVLKEIEQDKRTYEGFLKLNKKLLKAVKEMILSDKKIVKGC